MKKGGMACGIGMEEGRQGRKRQGWEGGRKRGRTTRRRIHTVEVHPDFKKNTGRSKYEGRLDSLKMSGCFFVDQDDNAVVRRRP